MIGVYKSEPLKPVIDADHMPFHQIIRKLGLEAYKDSIIALPAWLVKESPPKCLATVVRKFHRTN